MEPNREVILVHLLKINLFTCRQTTPPTEATDEHDNITKGCLSVNQTQLIDETETLHTDNTMLLSLSVWKKKKS